MSDRIEEIRAALVRLAERPCSRDRQAYYNAGEPDPCVYDETYGCIQHDDKDDWRRDAEYLLGEVERLRALYEEALGAAHGGLSLYRWTPPEAGP